MLVGWTLFVLALVPWVPTIFVSPYDTMGTEPHNIRANVAQGLLYCFAASTMLFIASGALLFTGGTKLQGWKRQLIGAMFLFFLVTNIAHAIWVYQVLSRAS